MLSITRDIIYEDLMKYKYTAYNQAMFIFEEYNTIQQDVSVILDILMQRIMCLRIISHSHW